MMDKGNVFVGQPVLSQILDVIPSSFIQQSSRKHQANKYYKSLPIRVQLVSLLYRVFSYCNGQRELSEGLLACEGNLSHFDLDKPLVRSSLTDTNNNRDYRVFESVYYGLLAAYHSVISDNRLKGLSIRNLKVIDNSTIQ
jgi:hypothetical protein